MDLNQWISITTDRIRERFFLKTALVAREEKVLTGAEGLGIPGGLQRVASRVLKMKTGMEKRPWW